MTNTGLLGLLLQFIPPGLAATPPGGTDYPQELSRRLDAALRDKGPDYRPRTEHLRPDGSPEFSNRLLLESSPYLLQHAHNPVDWYPWGAEAFARARAEGKPVFLSIGYSTCHWCHVMEKESFENLEIAAYLNRHFIAIKVDRERRPDVDANYMTAIQLIRGNGGWPASSFLTPEGKPFYGGTYYPPGQFLGLLKQISKAWTEDRDKLVEQADQLAAAVAEVNAAHGRASGIDDHVLSQAATAILSEYDPLQGGFGQAPKFPQESLLDLLLESARRDGDNEALDAALNTLRHIAAGGIHDQIGGGFHRYATDPDWLIPHFEKMLYNQAALGRLYLQAWSLTGKAGFVRVVRDTLDYVLRDMQAQEGAFYSASDADSEGREGRYYLWTLDEVGAALSGADADLAIAFYGLTRTGNFDGGNILYRPMGLEEFAHQHKLDPDQLQHRLTGINQALLKVRQRRQAPLRDDKIITAWNGAMIATLAEAGDWLGENAYIQAATRAADYLWQHHRDADGHLWRNTLAGQADVPAVLSDYAAFGGGLVALYDATGETIWLLRAEALADRMLTEFWDPEHGGLYSAAAENAGVALLSRPREAADNALPSGNGLALNLLARLWHRTGKTLYQERAEALLAAFSSNILRSPAAHATLLTGLAELRHGASGPDHYAARGAIRIRSRMDSGDGFGIDLDIRPGWHINANKPLDKDLIPTELLPDRTTLTLDEIDYPGAEQVKLRLSAQPLALYQGQVHIDGRVRTDGTPGTTPPQLRLRLQACSDRVCLAPEDVHLTPLPVSSGKH